MTIRRLVGALVLGLLAARSPSPTDPVAVYVEDVQQVADSAAANVLLDAPGSAFTGRPFFVQAKVNVGHPDTLLNFSGTLYYDTTLVRPTGRIQDPFDEVRVASFTDGTALGGECGEPPTAAHAAIQGISWKNGPGGSVAQAEVGFEFMPIAEGTAVFAWSGPFTGCDEATLADGDYDRKPTGVIWKAAGYQHAPASGALFTTTDVAVTLRGDTKTKADFFRSNPESLETYFRLTPTTFDATTVGQTVTATVEVWFPYAIEEGDSIGISIVWESMELQLNRLVPHPGWEIREPGAISDHNYSNWTFSEADDALCGMDSAAVKEVWVSRGSSAPTAEGAIVDLEFEILRLGGARARLGCDLFENYPNVEAFIPNAVVISTGNRTRDRYPVLLIETQQQRWLWRRGTGNTTVTFN